MTLPDMPNDPWDAAYDKYVGDDKTNNIGNEIAQEPTLDIPSDDPWGAAYNKWVGDETAYVPTFDPEEKNIETMPYWYQQGMQRYLDYASGQPGTTATTETNWDNVPDWQKTWATIANQGWAIGALSALPITAVTGTMGLLAGGPVGGIVGVVGGLGAGAGLGFLGSQVGEEKFDELREIYGEKKWIDDIQNLATGVLEGMDWFAKKTEQTAGLGAQLGEAYLESVSGYIPDAYWAIRDGNYAKFTEAWMKSYEPYQEVLSNLKEAFAAGEITYGAFDAQRSGLLKPSNIPAAIEYGIDYLMTGESDVIFAGAGEVWHLGNNRPVKIDQVGLAAINMAKQDMLQSNSPPSEIISKYKEALGFSEEFADLLFYALADPLNVLPFGESAAFRVFGDITGDTAAIKAANYAFGRGEGIVSALRRWGTEMRTTKTAIELADMPLWKRKAANVTPEGLYAEWAPVKETKKVLGVITLRDDPVNPGGWKLFMNDLTPKSKGVMALNALRENLDVLFADHQIDHAKINQVLNAWIEGDARQLELAGKVLEMSEAVWLKPGLLEAKAKLGELWADVIAAEDSRIVVLEIARMIEADVSDVFKYINEGDFEGLYTALTESKIETLSEFRDVILNKDGLMTLLEEAQKVWQEKPHALDGGAYNAAVREALIGSVEDYVIDLYGITRDSEWAGFVQGLKGLQSFILLSNNPGYLVNNVVNNAATMIVDGVFGLHTESHIIKYFKDLGLEPPRLVEGVTPTEEGKAGMEYTKLNKATRGEGLGFKFKDKTKWLSKLGLAQRASSKLEGNMGANAYYVGFKKALNQGWNPDTVPKMSQRLVDALKMKDERLPDTLIAAAVKAKSINDVIKIFNGVDAGVARHSVETYYSRLAKESGVKVDKIMQVFDESGVSDLINDRLASGMSPMDAIHNSEMVIINYINKLLGLDIEARAKELGDLLGMEEPSMVEMAKNAEIKPGEVNLQDAIIAEALKYDTVEEFRKANKIESLLQEKYKNVDLAIHENGDEIKLSKIVVPENERGSGIGTQLMNELINYADITGQRIVLTASPAFGGSVSRLKAFYSRFGFVENKGKAKDFSTRETLIRPNKTESQLADIYNQAQGTETGVKKQTDLEAQAEQNKVNISQYGFTAAMDIFKDIQVRHEEFWTRHFTEMERMFETADKIIDPTERNKFIEQRMSRANEDWKMQKAWGENTYRSVFEALKSDSELSKGFLKEYSNLNKSWNKFFDQKNKIMKEYFDQYGTGEFDPRAKQEWYKNLQKVDNLYREHSNLEAEYNVKIGNVFVDLWARTFGDESASVASEWWNKVTEIGKERTSIMSSFRAWERGAFRDVIHPDVLAFFERHGGEKVLMSGDDIEYRRALWSPFVEEVYLPTIGEHIKAGLEFAEKAQREFMGMSEVEARADVSRAEQANVFDYVNEQRKMNGDAEYSGMDEISDQEFFEALNELKRMRNEEVGKKREQALKYRTDNPKFKEWFGDSKMVDENGDPLIVYHGTTASFDKFNLPTQGELGIHFGTVDQAHNVANLKYANEGQNIIPVYLRIENPLKLDFDPINWYPSDVPEILMKAGHNKEAIELKNTILELMDRGQSGAISREEWATLEYKVVMKTFEDLGFDGVEYLNSHEGEGTSYMVFDPDQIRSVWDMELFGEAKSDPLPVGPMMPGAEGMVSSAFSLADAYHDGWVNHARPMLDKLAEWMITETPISDKGLNLADLDAVAKQDLQKWIGQIKQERPMALLNAMRHGENARDLALLNYNKRYNFDAHLSQIFPYQFWYTRSMMNWAMRLADRPAIMANYMRLMNMEEAEDYEIPTRLKGKIRIPMPFLPDWAGDAIYIDPIGKLFPPREFMRSFENFGVERSRIYQSAISILYDMERSGEISAIELEQALEDKKSELWKKAYRQSERENSEGVMSYVNMLSSPALYLTIPYNLLRGEDYGGPYPMSRMLQGLATATGMEGLRKLDVENYIRENADLSTFGKWGNYYIERQIANMIRERECTYEEASNALLTQEGDLWNAAAQRVQYEQMLKQPGMSFIETFRRAMSGDAEWSDLIGSVAFGWLPNNIFPQAELENRGLYDIYQQAWKEFNAGDKEAINDFMDKYPEYNIRQATFEDDPEKRLKFLMRNEIWEAYGELSGEEKRYFKEQFGDEFTQKFLNIETRNYYSISGETMTEWAQALGGYVPEGMAQGVYDSSPPELQLYLKESERIFPGAHDRIWEEYIPMTPDEREEYANQNSDWIYDYWDWQRDIFKEVPGLEQMIYGNDEAELFSEEYEEVYGLPDMSEWDGALLSQLYDHKVYGDRLMSGATSMLKYYYIQSGAEKKGITFNDWVEMITEGALAQ